MHINSGSMCWLTFLMFGLITYAESFGPFPPSLYSPSGWGYPPILDPFEPIGNWFVASSAGITQNVTELSAPGIDFPKWHFLFDTKGTLMAALIGDGVYNETALFNSTNLQNVDSDQFRMPWYYRSRLDIPTNRSNTTYHILRTNGISSRADIYVNGHLVADKTAQAGAYVGSEYEITDKLRQNVSNILLIKVYPTDYDRDLALGFVDWNPYPPDNGTGVWRDVEWKQTGQVSLSSPRVNTKLDGSITVHLDVSNLAQQTSATGYCECMLYDPRGVEIRGILGGFKHNVGFSIAPSGHEKLEIQGHIHGPRLWWPRQWGDQPLYSLRCSAFIEGTPDMSDSTRTTRFGIRTVTSEFDPKHNDTTFFVNGERFQVLGAGYTSDMFLRFDESKILIQFWYIADMGLNTIRLEGKQEHPRLFELADEWGIMLLAGWECCDKWEGWTHNDEGSGAKWVDADYSIANLSMRHEAEMMQTHPSMLGFLIGSDFWPDERATQIYVDALHAFGWDTPIISSASQRGAPALLGNGGMKMDGPYDWVPPNYWYDPSQRLGSAGGFGSELGAGVGTPPFSSLRRFLSPGDLSDLWEEPRKGLYHMSTNVSSFHTREIYNTALWARMGPPTDLDDYLMKAAMMDYEATKAQFEAYSPRISSKLDRPATGMIYWMLNNAWPSLHWNLIDYYLTPGAAYFGAKSAVGKMEHVVYDYETRNVHLVSRGTPPPLMQWPGDIGYWKRSIDVEVMDLGGNVLAKYKLNTNKDSPMVAQVPELHNVSEAVLLRLVLADQYKVLSRNTYWLSPTLDQLDWDNSTWYHTPVSKYADLSALSNMAQADVTAVYVVSAKGKRKISLHNKSKVPAVFIRMNLLEANGLGMIPVFFSQNFLTLWPGEEIDVDLDFTAKEKGPYQMQLDGRNVAFRNITIE